MVANTEGPARSPGQHDCGGNQGTARQDPANQPWLLYGLGGLVAVMLYMAGVPMLAFALGMYIPISINMAVLAGAFASYIVGNTGGSEKVKKARQDQGVLIASGLMAAPRSSALSPPSCGYPRSARQCGTCPSVRSSGLPHQRPAEGCSWTARPATGTRASGGKGSAC